MMLSAPHMVHLEAFAERIRAARPNQETVPSFDPCDGGSEARVLLLLEAPGLKAVQSGFVSRNNPDPTARNMLEALQEADLARVDTALWNIVPWYIGDGGRIHPAMARDVRAAQQYLAPLLLLLPRLQEVVLVGQKAQRARPWLAEHSNLRVSQADHPSNRVYNRWPERRRQVIDVLRQVACRLTDD